MSDRFRLGGRVIAAALLAGGLAVLAALTIAVVADRGPLPGDVAVIRRLQRLAEPAPSLASFVRLTTSTEACLIATIPAIVWLARRHSRRVVGLALAIALVWLLVIQPVSKELVDRPRPSEDLVDVRADYSSKSYPSGHSLSTTTTWGAAGAYAWRRGRRAWAPVLAIPIVATWLSSSIQGVHWPSDAVAGTIIGALGAWWIVRVLQPVKPSPGAQSS